jgi:formylglycine-generating enzyme
MFIVFSSNAQEDLNVPKLPPTEQIDLISVQLCPSDMIEIKGNYCPSVIEQCLHYDPTVHNVNGYVRCMEFAPTKCLTPKEKLISLHFCIDKYEAPNIERQSPDIMKTWYQFRDEAMAKNKRLCYDYEWTFACEGEEMLPYSYGYRRDITACNIDHNQKPWFDAAHSNMNMEIALKLDQRVPSGSMPRCVSPFGVFDQLGNVDEGVINSSGKPYISGLMGGHWVLGARNRCRAETTIHGPETAYYQMGSRFCQDISQ